MLRVINNVSTTYCKSQNHIVSPAHADKAHREAAFSVSPAGLRAARFFGVYVRAPRLISRFRAPECAQSRVLRVGDCSGGVETQASNTWIDLHTRTSVQRTHPPHNNTHSTQRKLARGAVLRCEPTRAMLGHAFTLCSSAICRQSPACSCTADLHLRRRDEVVVARQLKHAAYRTARVEQQHRWFLSHTQAPPVALEQTEAGRGIAEASRWPARSLASGLWEAARAYPRREAASSTHVLLARRR